MTPADSLERPDPPIEPMQGSTRWVTTPPTVLDGDLSLPILIVRLGAACNALIAQQRQTVLTTKGSSATSMRDLLWSFFTAASFTKEALVILTGQTDSPPEASRVKELAIEGGASEELVKRIGQLCGGSHPASPILTRVRNKMGFHWDPTVVGESLAEFQKNKALVWLEAKDEKRSELVFRLSADVLANAILQSKALSDASKKDQFDVSLGHVSRAIDDITEYFHYAILAYFERVRAEPHTT